MEHQKLPSPTKVTVMGAGSWGTTMAKVFADSNCQVTLWARRPEIATAINAEHCNQEYLPNIQLPPTIIATADPALALSDAHIIVLAVPSQSLRENLTNWVEYLPSEALYISLAKGIENHSLETMSQVIAEVAKAPPERISVLSGPNLAREIASEQPAATVLACSHEATADQIQQLFTVPYFRAYTNRDVVGCEISGACKNVIALACGMTVGGGHGENTVAAVMTRGLAEVARLGRAMGAEETTFAGLAGLGDLAATCASPLSRNRTFGARLGAGASVAEATRASGHQVAEGVYSSRSVRALARKYHVDMPITEAVYRVCHEGVAPSEVIDAFMDSPQSSEHH